jgi:hypothetical protein
LKRLASSHGLLAGVLCRKIHQSRGWGEVERGVLFFWQVVSTCNALDRLSPEMLKKWTLTNFKSFKDRTELSLAPIGDHTEIDRFDQRCPICFSRGQLPRRFLCGAAV